LLAFATPPPCQTHQSTAHLLCQELFDLSGVIVGLEKILVMLVAVVVLDLVEAEN
jgi:hypothetical protein